MLDGPVADLVRKDKRFKELGLSPNDYVDKKAVVALLLKHPDLMQRPIVIRGKRAIIARPPEKLATLLGMLAGITSPVILRERRPTATRSVGEGSGSHHKSPHAHFLCRLFLVSS